MKDDKSTQSSRSAGSKAEDIAEKLLKEKGFIIRKRNFHFGKVGEIDIVAEDNGQLVFVEVKARTSHEFGKPIESINERKRSQLRKTALGYLHVNSINNMECRFDVVTIDFTDNHENPVIEHLINAFW
jgi:putative endonuclease